ncbi:MAG: hypothetical protein AB1689_18050 [Thermodesulfobacteriota bacterium]
MTALLGCSDGDPGSAGAPQYADRGPYAVGVTTSTKDAPQPGECAHDDFAGAAGEQGFDDQLWRAIGCIRGFQP